MENKYFNEKDLKDIITILFWSVMIIILMTLASCRTIKSSSTIEKRDSIKESSTFTLVKGSANLSVISNPCNEDGTLRPIFYESSTGGLKTTLTDNNGSINISQEQKQDTIFKEKLVYRDKLIYKDKETPIPYIPDWIKKTLTISLILNFLFGIWIFRKPLIKLIKPF